MSKLLNIKSIAVTAVALVTVGIIGAFVHDHNQSKASQKQLETSCPKTREQERRASKIYRSSFGLGLDDDPKILDLKQLVKKLKTQVRTCEKYGY